MSYNKLSNEKLGNLVKRNNDALKTAINADVQNLHVFISPGNTKLGSIPSVSLLPVTDCGNCKECKHSCYDIRHCCIHTTVLNTRARNSAILRGDRDRFFREVEEYIAKNDVNAFRWHIGGDIKDYNYLERMVAIARKFPGTKFLVFTKMFAVANAWLNDNGGEFPENLKILFSGWIGQKMPNPYNMSTAYPIFEGDDQCAPDGTLLCTGNCTECYKENRLCWNLKKGQSVGFPAH